MPSVSPEFDYEAALAACAAGERGGGRPNGEGEGAPGLPVHGTVAGGDLAHFLEAGFDGVISSGGGHVSYGDEVVLHHTIPAALLERIRTHLDGAGLIYWVLCAGLDQVLKGVAARVRTQ